MSVTNSNQLWLPFSKEELEISKTHISNAEESLSFFIALTDDDVKGVAKLDNNRENFIRDVITEMTNAKGSIPTLANLPKLSCFYANYGTAYDIEDIYAQAEKKARRNRMWNGGKAYDQASRYYFDLDTAIKDKIEGAKESKTRLAKYFAGQGPGNGDKSNGNDSSDKK